MSDTQVRPASGPGHQVASRPPASPARWPAATIRLIFGVILGIDAFFKWLPAFRNTYTSQLKSVAHGQPAWLHGWFHFWISLQSAAPTVFAVLTAIAETGLALCVLLGAARRLGYTVGAVYMLLIWAIGEGFGGPYTAGSTDIGAGIVYSLLFITLLALTPPARHDPLSLDPILASRWNWWRLIAEPHATHRATAPSAQPATRRGASHRLPAANPDHIGDPACANAIAKLAPVGRRDAADRRSPRKHAIHPIEASATDLRRQRGNPHADHPFRRGVARYLRACNCRADRRLS